MSFILKNTDLMEELIRLAQVQTGTAPPDPEKIKALAVKLLGNLDTQINQSSQFTSEKDNASLRMNNILPLENFLYFLNYNVAKSNGAPIVIKHDKQSAAGFGQTGQGDAAFKLLSPEIQKQYVKYPAPEGDDQDEFNYWVNEKAMIAYVQELQKNAKGLMANQLDKLTKEITDKIGINIPAYNPNEIKVNPNVALDDLANTIVVQAPYDMGTNGILQRDLSSRSSLWNFLKSHNISLKNGDQVKKVDEFLGSDLATIVQVLFARATKYVETRESDADKLYYQLVKNLMSSMGVSPGSTQSDQKSPNQNAAYQNVGYQQGGEQAVTNMASLPLPLVRGQVVFERIKDFTEAFAKLMPQSNYPRTTLASLQVIDKYGLQAIQLQQDSYKDIENQIKNFTGGRITSAGPLFEIVKTMLGGVEQMLMQIQQLARKYENSRPLQEYVRDIDEQVKNVYADNVAGLNILNTQVQDALREVAYHARQGRR